MAGLTTPEFATQVSAVRVELPMFDPDDAATWLLMCENLLIDAGVNQQSTMFRKVLAKLPPPQFRLVKHLALQRPLPNDCFDKVQACLKEQLDPTPAERLLKMESLPHCVGDRKPSDLYLELQALYPNDMDHEIIQETFLQRMPSTLGLLCRGWLKELSLRDVSIRADSYRRHQPDRSAAAVTEPSSLEPSIGEEGGDTSVTAVRRSHQRPASVPSVPYSSAKRQTASSNRQTTQRASYFVDRWCRIHKRYGPEARTCLGRRFLVDSGSEVSILPPNATTGKTPAPTAPRLRAANGTKITVFEVNRLTKVDLGLGRVYSFKFLVADVPMAILGADFLREQGLIPDLRAACLRDGRTFLSVHSSGPQRGTGAIVHVSVENRCPSNQADGTKFQDIRKSQNFRSLADPPGQFPSVTMPGVDHTIETRGRPVYARSRRLRPDKLAAAKRELDELVSRGILVPSSSQWSSPIHLVSKDNGASFRMVGSYERLNAITVPDRYPVPDLQTFADRLDGSTIFSKIDLARAYAQIKMNTADQAKTAITTPFDLFEYTRMPFGLKNAAQTFQRLMDTVVRGLPRVFVYIDDILVFSRTDDEHRTDLHAVFERLHRYGLTIRPEKCVFGQPSVEFLRFKLSRNGLSPLPDKVCDLLNLAPPRAPADCRRFIGMINYYHRFLPELASVLQPLHRLANEAKRRFSWTQEHETAFQKAKQLLTQAATLAFPRSDAPTQVVADASDAAIGAVIQQFQDYRWVPIAFHSKNLTDTQVRWSTGDKELFALVSAVRRFRYLLEGRQNLQLCTDHKPLIHAFTSTTERSARVQRQLAFLSEFSTDIRHISGRENAVSDCLSRPSDLTVSHVRYDGTTSDFAELAKQQQNSPEIADLTTNQSLRIESRRVKGTDVPLLVDMSTGQARPLVPHSLQRATFDRLHNLHHPGARATKRLVTDRFVWTGMSADIARWCRTCMRCQSSKIGRHQRTQLIRPPTPSNRFAALHVDVVGPLDYCRGYQYVFTIIDRYTRYPEAIPIVASTAVACARALLSWISRFGMCISITSDRGKQFTSELWRELFNLLGVQGSTTLAYEPHQNGLVERMHRNMKASLMAVLQGDPNWADALPLVLMGMRASLKPDIGRSAAELLFGETLRLPGQFFDRNTEMPHSQFARNLQRVIAKLRPTQTEWHQPAAGRPVFISSSMRTATHVFVRIDAHRTPLRPPYNGPYKVLERGPKSFLLETEAGEADRGQANVDATTTRSGRQCRPPARFSE
uniref:RNA-directed DNA polymerase n=1 Tax=Trichuris muris TaxID=70415 RepID=A0A5S6Q436_TRIMR